MSVLQFEDVVSYRKAGRRSTVSVTARAHWPSSLQGTGRGGAGRRRTRIGAELAGDQGHAGAEGGGR